MLLVLLLAISGSVLSSRTDDSKAFHRMPDMPTKAQGPLSNAGSQNLNPGFLQLRIKLIQSACRTRKGSGPPVRFRQVPTFRILDV